MLTPLVVLQSPKLWIFINFIFWLPPLSFVASSGKFSLINSNWKALVGSPPAAADHLLCSLQLCLVRISKSPFASGFHLCIDGISFAFACSSEFRSASAWASINSTFCSQFPAGITMLAFLVDSLAVCSLPFPLFALRVGFSRPFAWDRLFQSQGAISKWCCRLSFFPTKRIYLCNRRFSAFCFSPCNCIACLLWGFYTSILLAALRPFHTFHSLLIASAILTSRFLFVTLIFTSPISLLSGDFVHPFPDRLAFTCLPIYFAWSAYRYLASIDGFCCCFFSLKASDKARLILVIISEQFTVDQVLRTRFFPIRSSTIFGDTFEEFIPIWCLISFSIVIVAITKRNDQKEISFEKLLIWLMGLSLAKTFGRQLFHGSASVEIANRTIRQGTSTRIFLTAQGIRSNWFR